MSKEMEKAFDEAYPKDKREKPVTHEALVAEIADLKASFSSQRLSLLIETITDLEHQIKVLSERHNDDVEKIEKRDKLLSDIRNFLDRSEQDCFGKVLDSRDRQGWYIRDEVIDNITKMVPEEQG